MSDRPPRPLEYATPKPRRRVDVQTVILIAVAALYVTPLAWLFLFGGGC